MSLAICTAADSVEVVVPPVEVDPTETSTEAVEEVKVLYRAVAVKVCVPAARVTEAFSDPLLKTCVIDFPSAYNVKVTGIPCAVTETPVGEFTLELVIGDKNVTLLVAANEVVARKHRSKDTFRFIVAVRS